MTVSCTCRYALKGKTTIFFFSRQLRILSFLWLSEMCCLCGTFPSTYLYTFSSPPISFMYSFVRVIHQTVIVVSETFSCFCVSPVPDYLVPCFFFLVFVIFLVWLQECGFILCITFFLPEPLAASQLF